MRFVAAGFAAAGLLIAAPANAQQTIVITENTFHDVDHRGHGPDKIRENKHRSHPSWSSMTSLTFLFRP